MELVRGNKAISDGWFERLLFGGIIWDLYDGVCWLHNNLEEGRVQIGAFLLFKFQPNIPVELAKGPQAEMTEGQGLEGKTLVSQSGNALKERSQQ